MQPQQIWFTSRAKLGDFDTHPMVLEHFKFLKAHTGPTPKSADPIASCVHFATRPRRRADRDPHPRRGVSTDLSQDHRKAVRAFADAGTAPLHQSSMRVGRPIWRSKLIQRVCLASERTGTRYARMINASRCPDIPAKRDPSPCIWRAAISTLKRASPAAATNSRGNDVQYPINVAWLLHRARLRPRWRLQRATLRLHP